MGPKEWTAAMEAALERVPLRRRPEVRAVRVTPGGYRVILHHNELTHRLLMQALLDRAEVNRVLSSWDASNGPVELCLTFGGDSLHEAEEMITIDARGIHALEPLRSRQRIDGLSDEGPDAWFRRTTGAALPFSLPRDLARCDVTAWETPGASEAFSGLPTTTIVLDNPADLTIFGYYGSVANGHSIYYIASEGPHYAFLRLHFGGAYGSMDQDRRYVTAYLRGYARFRDRTRPKLKKSVLLHNVGSTSLRVAFMNDAPDAELVEIPCSSWKEAEEAFDAHFEGASEGASREGASRGQGGARS